MPRLIDADALNWWDDLLMKGVNQSGVWVRYKDVEHFIKDAPTIDAVPVVRCFYCKHWREPRSAKTIPWCNHLKTVMHASDFCNYGKRREDGDA